MPKSTPTNPASGPGANCPPGAVAPCTVPDLEIVDQATGAPITGTTQTVVGKKIRLLVRSRPTGHSVTDIRWTIPEKKVKGYTQSTGSGVVTNVAPADLTASTIEFHWIDGGTKSVQVSAKVDGAPKTATATFNVLRPTVNHFTIVVSGVNVTTQHWQYAPNPALTALQPVPPPMQFGSQWDAKVTAPANGDGEIGFTQLINVNRTRTPNAGTGQNFSSGGVFVLDDGLGIQYSGSQPIAAGGDVTLNGNAYADSPGTPLTANLRAKTADESFQLFLMYKPAGADSIWVTLRQGAWTWKGSATRNGAPAGAGNNWTLGAGAGMTRTAPTDSTALPEWTSSFASVSWI